jgi:hypothetical protein
VKALPLQSFAVVNRWIALIAGSMAMWAIAEFRDGTRVGLFAVFESDFLTVLESNRGSSKQLKKGTS